METDLRADKERLPDYNQFGKKSRQEQTQNNVIPIGILDIDGTLMTQNQLEENAKSKKEGKKADADRYERLSFFSASVLQEDVFQGNVAFRLSPSLYFGNNKNKIKHIDIDFQDGSGFRPFDFKEQTIGHRFKSVGEHAITLRIFTDRGTFFCYTKVNVRQLERTKAFRNFTVSAPPVRTDTITPQSTTKGGRVAAAERSVSVTGANVRVLLGCDGVLDRPVIIGEGFDIGQDRTLDDLEADYFIQLATFRSAGYDLVLVDYQDARTHIENNANVLKAVIQEVNRTKTGTNRLVVIGESMSGLIARYAIRQMEIDGLVHNVGHYISFDSPQQGANVPVGILERYWNASRSASFLTRALYPILSKSLRNTYQALRTPAATQLLRRYGGSFGVGNPHPEFLALQQRLQNMGYPQQCTNLAVISGSGTAGDLSTRARYSPGDLIMNSTTPYILQNSFIQVKTHRVGDNTNVLIFTAVGILLNHATLSYISSNVNDDFLPGGFVEIPYNLRQRQPKPDFRASFVPTYSSIDYQGPRNDQGQRQNLNIQTALNASPRLTPFLRIYTPFGNQNAPHVDTNFNNWDTIARDIASADGTTANSCPSPPVPVFGIGFIPCPANDNPDNPTASEASLFDPGAPNQYDHFWSASPFVGFTGTGFYGVTFVPGYHGPGLYTITVTRRYKGLPNPTSSYSQTFYICSTSADNPCDFVEGDFVVQLNDTGENAFARYHNGVLYAALENGAFISRSRIAANGIPEPFVSCFATNDPRNPGTPMSLPLSAGCYTLQAKHSAKFLQVDDGNSGTRLRQQNENGANNQLFRFDVVDGDSYRITPQTGNKAVEASGAGTAFGTPVVQADWNGGNHQKWKIESWGDDSYKLLPKHDPSIAFDIEGVSQDHGAGVHLWGQHGGDNQRFRIRPVANCVVTPPVGGCTYRSISVVSPVPNQTLTANSFPFYFDIQTQVCDPEGVSQVQYNIVDTDGSSYWAGYVDTPNNGSSHPYTYTAGRWATLASTNNAFRINQPGTYIIQVRLFSSVSGVVMDASSVMITVVQGGGNPNPPVPGGLAFVNPPSFDCNTGQLVVSTTGGNGQPVEFRSPGLQDWNTNNVFTVPTWQRNGTAFTIQARQSGNEIPSMTYTTSCAGYRFAAVGAEETESGLLLAPNPTPGPFTVRFLLPAKQTATLSVVNVVGQSVWQRDVIGTGQTQTETVDIHRETTGQYVVRLKAANGAQTGKLLLVR